MEENLDTKIGSEKKKKMKKCTKIAKLLHISFRSESIMHMYIKNALVVNKIVLKTCCLLQIQRTKTLDT